MESRKNANPNPKMQIFSWNYQQKKKQKKNKKTKNNNYQTKFSHANDFQNCPICQIWRAKLPVGNPDVLHIRHVKATMTLLWVRKSPHTCVKVHVMHFF